jgi:hypothetical protein
MVMQTTTGPMNGLFIELCTAPEKGTFKLNDTMESASDNFWFIFNRKKRNIIFKYNVEDTEMIW